MIKCHTGGKGGAVLLLRQVLFDRNLRNGIPEFYVEIVLLEILMYFLILRCLSLIGASRTFLTFLSKEFCVQFIIILTSSISKGKSKFSLEKATLIIQLLFEFSKYNKVRQEGYEMISNIFNCNSAFKLFSSRGTFETLIGIWRNLCFKKTV